MKSLFWNPITKSKTTALQSQSDVYQTTDKDVPLTPILCWCVSLRQVCLFSEQTGVFLSETDGERFLDSDESLCCSVLQRQLQILVPRKKVSGRSWWNTRRNTWGWIHGGTKDHSSEGNMTTLQTWRIKFESFSMCEYKLSNISIDQKVISRMTKFY